MDPFVAEIRIFPFNFAPKGWALCDGQILPISQNTALFSLLGTTYGGDGKSNFALPNLQGCAPMHPGQGPGLSLHDLGESSGTDTVTLLESGNVKAPASVDGLARSGGGNAYLAPDNNVGAMDPNMITPTGGGFPHDNLMPYLTLNFCIALQGVFPPRS
jgi:microcystin-dependent protein